MSEMQGKTEADKHYLRQAWLILFLSVFYGAILVGVQIGLSGRIAENKKQETYSQIPTLVPGAEPTATKEFLVRGSNGKESRVYQARNASGEPMGWVFPGSGAGFADTIEILIGLNADMTRLTGLYVLNQKETPGLGNYITENAFRDQFHGLAAQEKFLAVAGTPVGTNQIKAVTGATISSQSVCDIVNGTVAQYRQAALEKATHP
ncbi:MAG: FMN-binding protein [Planctomycetia bacterium]|nr:FMN-binding protein [Planctomycetia bacterium]